MPSTGLTFQQVLQGVSACRQSVSSYSLRRSGRPLTMAASVSRLERFASSNSKENPASAASFELPSFDMNASVKPRRKPSQSRSWMTTGAIQDAFVIAMTERGYERVSMREIASIAGVGLGTLYLYFPNKDSIAAVTVNAWMRRHADRMKSAMNERPGSTVRERADAMVRACAEELLSQPAPWRALLFLERRLTAPAVYQEVYLQHIDIVAAAFAAASDWPPDQDAHLVASHAFCISEAMLRNALLVHDVPPAMEPLTATIQHAVRAAVQHGLGGKG